MTGNHEDYVSLLSPEAAAKEREHRAFWDAHWNKVAADSAEARKTRWMQAIRDPQGTDTDASLEEIWKASQGLPPECAEYTILGDGPGRFVLVHPEWEDAYLFPTAEEAANHARWLEGVQTTKKPARRIPISAARRIARDYGQRQVILVTWDGARTHVVTYGATVAECAQAAQGGEMVRRALGWPVDGEAAP